LVPETKYRERQRIGLCATCVHSKIVRSDRGSVFYRCALSDSNPQFPKYPRLPVLHCAGCEPSGATPVTENEDRFKIDIL
jgi:hypothetical protein